jgi:LPXTG-site transpeptidase (sortase) family protein
MNQLIAYQKEEKLRKDLRHLTRRAKKTYSFGRLLILIGFLGFLVLVSPFLLMEIKYRLGQLTGSSQAEVSGFGEILRKIEEETGFGAMIRETDLAILTPVDPEFSVVIPKISVNSRVFANIDVEDEKNWRPILQKGVAHAKGSYFPDQEGTVYLFGHSTDYIWNIARFNAVFYLLKEMEKGDRASLFYQGERFEYEVTERKIIDPDQLEEINSGFDQSRLILQTCWPPGTTWKRLIVLAKPV